MCLPCLETLPVSSEGATSKDCAFYGKYVDCTRHAERLIAVREVKNRRRACSLAGVRLSPARKGAGSCICTEYFYHKPLGDTVEN